MNMKDMIELRTRLVTEGRALCDKADAEKRQMTDEESARHAQILNDSHKLGDQIEQHNRQTELDAKLEQRANEPINGNQNPNEVRKGHASDSPEYRSAFNAWSRGGDAGRELRALQVDSDVGGGFLIPQAMQQKIWQKVDNSLFFRQFATVDTLVGSDSLGVPTLETDPADADWTAEIGAVSADSSMAFGGRELRPRLLSKLLKVSQKLLRTKPDIESFLIERLAYKIGVPQENAYFNGSGAGQPLGVLTASASGISTGRDVSTSNTTTAITFDNLHTVKGTLKSQYMPNAKWMFHRDATTMIAKLKDSQNQYLWQPSNQVGQPDTLLGIPVYRSEYVPNTFTAGLYVGILGDFSRYWITDALNMSVQRLNELYAGNSQVGFIVRAETDGMPVFEEAFVRVALAP